MSIVIALFGLEASAGFAGYNGTTSLGLFNTIKCSSGLTCTKVGDKLNVVSSTVTTGTTSTALSTFKNFAGYQPYDLVSGGTSVAPNSATMYLSQILVSHNAIVTGVKVLNGATVGTNRYIVALYNSLGVLAYNSTLASSGTLSAGANTYQAIPFTVSGSLVGPGVYWIGVSMNGSIDAFRAVPAAGQGAGLAGSVTGQAFSVLPAVTVPTTFTADKGPIAFTY